MSVTLVSSKQYKLLLDIPKCFWDYCHQTGMGWLKSTNLQFSLCYIFVSFGNNVDIVVHYENSPFWISADINKDDLECPIHLKLHLAGCLTYVCCGIQSWQYLT